MFYNFEAEFPPVVRVSCAVKAAVQKLGQPVSDRKAIVIVGSAIAALLLGWGGWTLYGKLTGRPASPSEIKSAIRKYLARKTGDKEFKSPLDITSSLSNSTPGVSIVTMTNPVTVTNKTTGRVRRLNKIAKAATSRPETGFSVYFRTNQAQAETYEEMYRLIGQQLAMTDRLLENTNLPQS